MKTIKQIADEIGVDKQRVYRCVKKNNIEESYKNGIVMYYDGSAEKLIKNNFCTPDMISETHHETNQYLSNDTVVKILQQELEVKNRQISELTDALMNVTDSLKSAHALHAGTIQSQRQITGFSIKSVDFSSPQENTQAITKEPDKLRFIEWLKRFFSRILGLSRRVANAD